MAKLDEKLWLFSYSLKSESAKLLADKLDVWIIKHEGSNYRGKNGQFIFNWGAGTGVYNAKTGGATLLNPPNLVDVAVNKLEFFQAMIGKDSPRLPFWTSSKNMARMWLEGGHTVVARTRLEGAKGNGLVVLKNPLDFVEASLYTLKVNNIREYRVYMWNDEVLDARVKTLEKAKIAKQDGMLTGEDVQFVQIPLEDVPEDVKVQARKAARKLKLTTQGLDIVWDGNWAWVLESNSAPYLGIQTANKYVEKIKKLVQPNG